jgi:hypothetical protein
MTLKESIFNLCACIKKNNRRGEVQNTIKEINKNAGNPIGYYARKMRLQFASFLQIESKIKEMEKSQNPFSLSSLKDDDLELFTTLHKEIILLNNLCLSSLDKDLFPILSPYSYKGHYLDCKNINFNYLDKVFCEEVAGYFSKTSVMKSFNFYLDRVKVVSSLDLEYFPKAIWDTLKELNKFGYDLTPPIADSFLHNNLKEKELNAIGLILTACLVLSQLENVNQLIYQSFLNDKLAAATEDNIISIVGNNMNVLGETFRLEVLSTDISEVLAGPADICLLKFKWGVHEINTLGKITSSMFNMNYDLGDKITWNINTLDSELNLFHRLLPCLQRNEPIN